MWCRLRWLWWWWRWRCQQGPWPIVIARQVCARTARSSMFSEPSPSSDSSYLPARSSLSFLWWVPVFWCLCLCSYYRICVFVYLCIFVFSVAYECLALFPVGSTFCVIFLFLLLVVFVLRLLFLLCICVFDIFFCDHCSGLISIFMYLIYLFFSDQVSFQSWLYNQDWSLFISNKNVIKATLIRITKMSDVYGEW